MPSRVGTALPGSSFGGFERCLVELPGPVAKWRGLQWSRRSSGLISVHSFPSEWPTQSRTAMRLVIVTRPVAVKDIGRAHVLKRRLIPFATIFFNLARVPQDYSLCSGGGYP